MDAGSLIYKIFTITFLLGGTLTNILSAIVYSKKKIRKSSYAVYLFALAIADLSAILTGDLRLAIIHLNTNSSLPSQQHLLFDLREHSLVFCRLHMFLTYYFLQLSSVILCLLNLDRFCGCVLIFKTDGLCTPKSARKAILVSMIVLAVIDSHFLIAMGDFESAAVLAAESNNSTEIDISLHHKCTVHKPFVYVQLWPVFHILDGLIYCIIPFIIMITCNFMIICKMVRSRIRSKVLL